MMTEPESSGSFSPGNRGTLSIIGADGAGK